ncbi:putative pentatricopeptide repeat-containing protein, mitochondrial [Sarracenia purpurea var. burkii]
MAVQGPEMVFEGYDTILNECVNRRGVREGQRVHAHMIKTHYHPPVYLRTRLIVFYAKCECLGDARRVLDEMLERNVVSWTAMISAYSQRGYASEALNLFVQMLRSGTEPNEFTFATVLTSCTGVLGIEIGSQIHSLIIKSYSQLGLDEEALKLFRRFQREGMACNYVTYASLLNALSGLAALDHGKQVHNHVLRSELPSYVVLQNSLIDMYAKCGNLSYSRRVFDNIYEKTVISWNAMLVGYSKHGKGREVVELFKLMREENKVKPNSVTFLAVLSGCSHGGMEGKGLKTFDEMAMTVCWMKDVKLNLEVWGDFASNRNGCLA